MVRAGLGSKWRCIFANDFDPRKAAAYCANWGSRELHLGDVAALSVADLPGSADMAWASFPCQDLSLAGAGAGLKGKRSGTFWPFWKLMEQLCEAGRTPRLLVLENVCGALSSHDGKDFAAIGSALSDAGYSFGSLIIDAVHFLPQSRPRLFIVAVHDGGLIPFDLTAVRPDPTWQPSKLVKAYGKLPDKAKKHWVWWKLPAPPPRESVFADLIEDSPKGVKWHSPEETQRLLGMMSELHASKVHAAQKAGTKKVGAIYKRTRSDVAGFKRQRAEVRFDDVAGCLRTPAGGSSRQSIIIIDGENIRTRLLSPREAARLMGLPEQYKIPENYNEAYHLAGDGVAVPVVRFLASTLLEPLIAVQSKDVQKVALQVGYPPQIEVQAAAGKSNLSDRIAVCDDH